MVVKVKLLQITMLAVFVLQIDIVTAFDHETHQVPYFVGKTKTVCIPPINYTSCTKPEIKLSYHPSTSNSSVGILVYSKLYWKSDREVSIPNTTKYGINSVTSERNDSSLCVRFMKMSVDANGLIFSLDQRCGISKLALETTFYFKFILECNGTWKSERIQETRSKYIDVMPGNRVAINWTWCSAVNSTVTGIVIYRVTRQKSRISRKPILSMDLSNTVYYFKDKLKYELRTENETSFQKKTIFIVNNASRVDSGLYSLHIRRSGHSDLDSEVQVIVKATDPTKRLLAAPKARTEATELIRANNTSQSKKSYQRETENEDSSQLILSIVLPSCVGAILIVIALLFIRRMKTHKTRKGFEKIISNVGI